MRWVQLSIFYDSVILWFYGPFFKGAEDALKMLNEDAQSVFILHPKCSAVGKEYKLETEIIKMVFRGPKLC